MELPSNMEDEGSQLAEANPQIDLPQRIEAPMMMNAPQRIPVLQRDAIVRETIFSTRTHYIRKYKAFMELQQIPTIPKVLTTYHQHIETASESKHLKEYTILAASSKRGGRIEAETSAYFCMGVIQDNMEEYEKAIENYKKSLHLLSIEGTSANNTLKALLYCCIGVDYQLLACTHMDTMYTGGYVDANNVNLAVALDYHEKHLTVADEAGQFVAHTNLGLTLGSLARNTEAAKHHQEALRLAIRLNSAYGQSIAVGNLGLLASRQGDLTTATACMDQHLQLIQSVNDRSAEINAWMQLGLLATRTRTYDKAARYFEQAYQIATELNEIGIMKQASCYLGIAKGCVQADSFFKTLQEKLASVCV